MAEDNDIHCLLQMEGLRIDNKAKTKKSLDLINAALLDEKLSHEDLIAKFDLSILNKNSNDINQNIFQCEEEFDDISIAILTAAKKNDAQKLIDSFNKSASETIAKNKTSSEKSAFFNSHCNSKEICVQFTFASYASSMSAYVCIPSTNYVSVELNFLISQNYAKPSINDDPTSSFDKSFEDYEPQLVINTEDDCSSIMSTCLNTESTELRAEETTEAMFNVEVLANYETMFNTISNPNHWSGSSDEDMADLSKNQNYFDERFNVTTKENNEKSANASSMQDVNDLEIQVLSHIKPSEFQFINKLYPISQTQFYSQQCQSMFGNGSTPLINENLPNSACVSNIEAEQDNDDIIYLTTLKPISKSLSPKLVSLQEADKGISEQPIYRRRTNRHQFSDHSSHHLKVFSSQSVVGLPGMSYKTNHTHQQDGTFVRDGQHYGPPEISNPPIYPNISKRFTENPLQERGVSLRDLRFPVCAPNLFASSTTTTSMFRTRSKSFNRRVIRRQTVSPIKRQSFCNTDKAIFFRGSAEDLNPPIYNRSNRNYRSKSVANFRSNGQSVNYRSGRSCRVSPEPSFSGHMSRFCKKDMSRRDICARRKSLRAKSVSRVFDAAIDNERKDFTRQRVVYNWSKGRLRAKSCGPLRCDINCDSFKNYSPRRNNHVRYNLSKSCHQYGYSSNVQRAMALFNDRKRKIEMEATHFGSNNFEQISFPTNNFCNDHICSRNCNKRFYCSSSSWTSPTSKRMKALSISRHSQIDMLSSQNCKNNLSSLSPVLQNFSNRPRSKHSRHKSSHRKQRRSASSLSSASSSSAYSSASSSSMSSDTAAIIDAVKKLRKHKKRKSKKSSDKKKHKLLKISSNDLDKLFKKWSKSTAPYGSLSGSLCVSKADFASTSRRRCDRNLFEKEKLCSYRSRSHLPLESNSDNCSNFVFDSQYYNQNVRDHSRSKKISHSSSNHVFRKRNR